MTGPDTTAAEQLGEQLVGISYASLPAEVIERAKLCILDQLGVQLRGATMPHVQPALRVARSLQAAPQSTIVFHGERTASPYAAFVNASFGHSCEYDDAHFLAGHPGTCVVPTALAFAEAKHADGAALLTSVVTGYQGAVTAIGPVHHDTLGLGWHGMKLSGVFGAAAAVGKLLDFDAETMTNALAVAASEASGTMEYDQSGGEVKRVHAGMAARSGSEAALLAAEGLTGPHTILEGRRGIWRLFGRHDAPERQPLPGERLYILDTIFKLYPCVGTLHSALDAVRMITEQDSIDPADVSSIEVGMSDWAVSHGGTITRPSDVISAQFSLGYSLALLLARGSNDIALYMEPALWSDPELLEIVDKVKSYEMPIDGPDAELGAKVTVTMADGRVLEAVQRAFRGHHSNPATAADIEGKFRENASVALSPAHAERLLERVGALEQMADCAELLDDLVDPARRA